MSMTIKVVTPTKNIIINDISRLHLKTIDGDITILKDHFPLMSAIDVSVLKLKKNKEYIYAFISDGVIQVKQKEVILLVNAFEFKEDIDLKRAEASYNRALQRINNKTASTDLLRAEASLKRALTRINLSKS